MQRADGQIPQLARASQDQSLFVFARVEPDGIFGGRIGCGKIEILLGNRILGNRHGEKVHRM